MKNIVLTGFMGSGKSTIASIIHSLSKNLEVFDMDKEIEKAENMAISQIFEQKGEQYFRDAELEMTKSLSASENKIISTGGGIIGNPDCIANLRKSGIIYYLQMAPERIYDNIKDDNSRPLLAGGDKLQKIKSLLARRDPLYSKYADNIIVCEDLSIARIAKKILIIHYKSED